MRGGWLSSAATPPSAACETVGNIVYGAQVYVLGSRTVVCKRPSLNDVHLTLEAARRTGVQPLPRISCKSTYALGSPEDKLSAGVLYDTAAMRASAAARGEEEDEEEQEEAALDSGCGGAGPMRLSQARSMPDLRRQEAHCQEQQQQHPAAPPDWVTSALAGTLRDKLGLQLFNFDMICPADQPEPGERLYYVVGRAGTHCNGARG